MFPMLFCLNSVHFSEIQLVGDGPTDGRTDGRTEGRTDGRTDTPSYRDARTHLKINLSQKYLGQKKEALNKYTEMQTFQITFFVNTYGLKTVSNGL